MGFGIRKIKMTKEKINKISKKETKTPNVGVSVFIFDYSSKVPHVLLGKRINKNNFGDGQWQLPGGNIELFESSTDAARREAIEEAGLILKNTTKIGFTDNFYPEINKHYVTVYFSAEIIKGLYSNFDENSRVKVDNLKPEKCEGWQWFPIDNLPKPLFGGIEEIIEEWSWKKQISAIEAIIYGGKEFIVPYKDSIDKLKNHFDNIKNLAIIGKINDKLNNSEKNKDKLIEMAKNAANKLFERIGR